MGISLDPPDYRLEAAFKKLTGVHYPAAATPLFAGNYKEFTRDRIDLVYAQHAEHLLFTNADTGPEKKTVWITEYNLDDKIETGDKILNQKLQPFGSAGTNSFAHAAMMQHWFLWNLKSSFNEAYRPYFLEYATIQNYISGSTVGLLTQSDRADQQKLNEITSCAFSPIKPHQVRRATYYGPRLWKSLTYESLEYLKTHVSMYSLNDNLAPSVFIHVTTQEIYVYFTNVKPTTQRYAFDPSTLGLAYDDQFVELNFLPVTGEILDADQLYSTAGRSALFDLNMAYNECSDEILMENRFELTGIDNYTFPTSCPPAFTADGGVCVAVPGYSMGYFRIEFDVTPYRKGEVVDNFMVFPNPTSTSFIIQQRNLENELNSEFVVKIYTPYGNLVKAETIAPGELVDISQLPVGMYTLVIHSESSIETETLIKMK